MALSSTVHAVDIDLADSDRQVYESFSLRVARHPSESEDFLVARLLAYCCEYAPGIAFSSGGLSDPDDPPIGIRDDAGRLRAWIDIGTPSADRLHRASKAVPRVAVYVHRDATQWLAGLATARIHRAEDLEIHLIDRTLVAGCVARLDRRISVAVARSDGEVFVSYADETVSGRVTRVRV